MWRFQFMGHRLHINEVIRWLKDYLDVVCVTDAYQQVYHNRVVDAYELGSVHRQLMLEATIMELNSTRTWLEMSITRLTGITKQTGEFVAIPPSQEFKGK